MNTGASVWQKAASVYAGIASDKNALYVTEAQQSLKSYDLATGKLCWEQKGFDRDNMLTAPVVYGDFLLVADNQGYLHALNKLTGLPVGSGKISYQSGYLAPPLIDGKHVIMFADDGSLTAIDLKIKK